MICTKCGDKALSKLCWKCKPKKPLANSKGLNSKMYVKSVIKSKKAYNSGHIIHNIDPHNHYEVLKENERINKIFQKAIQADLLKQFFIEQWNTRPHYCEVSGKFLGNNFSTLYQHHLLEKRNYPEACLDGDNIVFLTPEIHASVELDKFKYEYINKKRELLKIKYNIL